MFLMHNLSITKNKIIEYVFPFALCLIAVWVAVASYKPGTILSGWDTLHPEFDIWNYIHRILTVWQPHQGLGAPPSQAHLADFFRMIPYLFFSLTLPMDMVRYVYILLMLPCGVIGVYIFLRFGLLSGKPYARVASFFGALWYLGNFGTPQHFYTPLEMFVTFYGFVGWFYLAVILCLKASTRPRWLFLILTTIFMVSTAHTATLWYVFFAGLVLVLGTYWVLSYFSFSLLKRICLIIVVVLSINIYWILPNVYYVKHYNKDVQLSKTHRLFSNEFFLRGQKRGTLKDTVLLTNFPFDWYVYDHSSKKMVPQMGPWVDHVTKPVVEYIGYGFFLLVVLGMIYAWRQKNWLIFSFSPLFAVCLFFLINANPPFTHLFLFLRDSLSLFREGFRFPFTKFSLYAMFIFSIYYAYILQVIFSYLFKKDNLKLMLSVVVLFLIGAHFYFALPTWTSGVILPEMRVTIPKPYFELFDWFKQKPSRDRILTLPLNPSNGWVYHAWGYQGAGFMWFGLRQPLLDREFDRWYPYNEEAYRELSYALYAQDVERFGDLLHKYRIKYIVSDDSVTSPGLKNVQQFLFSREATRILNKLSVVTPITSFDFLHVYAVQEATSEIELNSSLVSVQPSFRWSYTDQAFAYYGDYYTSATDNEVSYPFRTFLNTADKLSPDLLIEPGTRKYSSKIEVKAKDSVFFPAFEKTEPAIYADLSVVRSRSPSLTVKLNYYVPDVLRQFQSEEYQIIPDIRSEGIFFTLNGKEYSVSRDVEAGKLTYVDTVLINTQEPNQLDNQTFLPQIRQVELSTSLKELKISGSFPPHTFIFNAEQISSNLPNETDKLAKHIGKDREGSFVYYNSVDSTVADSIDLGAFSQEFGYVVSFTSRNLSGLPLRICLFNLFSGRCDLHDELSMSSQWTNDLFVVPPFHEMNGYRLDIYNLGLGTIPATNELRKVELMPLSYFFLSDARIVKKKKSMTKKISQVLKGNYRWDSSVSATIQRDSLQGDSIVSYFQAFEPGWKAYIVEENSSLANSLPLFFGKELKDHVLVNNWANGWKITLQDCPSAQCRIVLLFWPQYLEFIGFGFLIGVIIWIALWKNKEKHHGKKTESTSDEEVVYKADIV